jgi:hypothetical protein
VLGSGQHVEHQGDVAGELLAVEGQRDRPVRAGAQQRGTGGVFELADLAGEDGVPDAELAGCVAEAGKGEELRTRCPAPGRAPAEVAARVAVATVPAG